MACPIPNCSFPMRIGEEISSSGGINRLHYNIDVHTLLHVTEKHPIEHMLVSSFPAEWISQPCWTNLTGPDVPRPAPDLFSPQNLLDDPARSPKHWRALRECDPAYPILIAKNGDGSWNMVNGKHRYVKAVLEKLDKLPVCIVSVKDLEAAKVD
ncbi:hypothetical protein BC830DRAFT_889273 [Chytriomyces sp. MP71]|nr:hypothetical protein BC830DRAFT_889273 [Chytriomyces sp. MP71]